MSDITYKQRSQSSAGRLRFSDLSVGDMFRLPGGDVVRVKSETNVALRVGSSVPWVLSTSDSCDIEVIRVGAEISWWDIR